MNIPSCCFFQCSPVHPLLVSHKLADKNGNKINYYNFINDSKIADLMTVDIHDT